MPSANNKIMGTQLKFRAHMKDQRYSTVKPLSKLVNYVPPKYKSKVSNCNSWIWGHEVAQLVEALRYKPEGSGFDWHPSGGTVVLESTQPLTEKSTRNISWGIKAAGA